MPITAAGCSATAQSRIGFIVVTIIADLTVLNDTITTTSGGAIGTGVRGVIVAVIATLAGADDAIAAARGYAGGQASVFVHLVAIITGFITKLARLQINTRNAIAAMGRRTFIKASVCLLSVAVIAGLKA